VGFAAPCLHSGEPYCVTVADPALWTSSISGGVITFATQTYATNVNANALRWGTLYNFRFDANAAPTTGAATLGLFKPGSPASLTVSGLPIPDVACPQSPNDDMNHDAQIDGLDVQRFVTPVITSSSAPSDLCTGDFS